MLSSLGHDINSTFEIEYRADKTTVKSKKMIRSAIIIENLKGINNLVMSLKSNKDSGIEDASEEELKLRREKFGVNYIKLEKHKPVL